MEIEQLEQIAAVIVTAGLVAGNFLMFTPWRNGQDPRQRQPQSLMPHHSMPNPDRDFGKEAKESKKNANKIAQ